jgi:hypothetical protein
VGSDHSAADRIVDVASVVLISAAAVFSALCSYQASRWGGEQARMYNTAITQRALTAEATNRTLALTAIDVNLFLNYGSALEAHQDRKARFIYQRLRPETRSALDAWLRTDPQHNPKAPSSPFAMPAYRDWARNETAKYDAAANASFNGAITANRHSDNFMLLTVIFAAVSFLGGMSTKMRYPQHMVIVILGTVALMYGIVRIAALPFL